MAKPLVKAKGRQAVLRCDINRDNLRLLRDLPNKREWAGRDVVFEPTAPAIDYIRKTWPEAEWDEGAKKFATVVDMMRKAAIPAPERKVWDYDYKTKPFAHQEEVFKRSRDEKAFALLMEQGTGKTKVTLDTAAWLYAHGKIQGLLILAKNGVHRNWITREIPAHLPDWCKPRTAIWSAQKGEKGVKHVFQSDPKNPQMPILAINIEGLSTPRAAKLAEQFLLSYPSLMVVDESTSIKTPSAKRTKAVLRLAGFAPYRRILTGTPVTKGPLDAYTQFGFLDEDILGFGSFFSFKARYSVLRDLPGKQYRGRPIKVVVGYQNLDELKNKIAPHSFRVLKKDCLDLPEKLYTRRFFQMTDEQWHHYNEFQENLITEFQGRRIAAPLAITRMMRLHQIACGYLPAEDPKTNPGVPIIPVEKNPRIISLLEALEECNGKAIIWATYRAALRDLWSVLREAYGVDSVVAYAGSVSKDDRERAVDLFQNSDRVRWFLGQTHSAGWGLTLTAANDVYYFNNDYDLEARQQSEDRAHRIGQKNNVLYTDFEAEDTIDGDIIDSLKDKMAIANEITGDEAKPWLEETAQSVDKRFLEKFMGGKK